MSASDFKLDSLLRDVTVPSGLLERLMALPYADDLGLDEAVREVEMPEGLLQRLAAIPLADDAGLDEALRDVPLPHHLQTSFRRHARRMATRHVGRSLDRALRISRIAMATSLILAVTMSLGSAYLLSWVINRLNNSTGPAVAVKTPVAPAPPEERLETSMRMLADNGVESDEGASKTEGASARREMDFVQLESAGDLAQREAIKYPTMPADPLEMANNIHVSPRSWDDSPRWDDLPELPFRPTKLEPHGLDWPLVKGSNRQLLIEKGFHPFVAPAGPLQTCAVPLLVDPSSYELARRYLERNEMPPPNLVRSEEFLAAMDYNFPRPRSRGLGLTLAGGPSPISGEEFSIMQVGAQAWQGDDTRHAPMHLVLLIDTSTSMRWGSRMELVRRALDKLPALTGKDDRLSVVTFNQAAHVLVENVDHDAISQFRAAADSLAAEGSTNFVGGLSEACGVARESLGAGRPAVRMVLLTDGLLDLDPTTAESIEKQVSAAAKQKIRFDVIDLGQQMDSDPQLAAIAQAGQGTVHRAVSAEQVRWAFREIVTGRSQLVARSARLHVTFNPKVVLEYRIIGHESGDWAGLLPGSLEADFREGQSATGLFELRLDPRVTDIHSVDEVAKVELSWYTPDGEGTLAGKTLQKATAAINRKQFAPSLTSAAPWLQQAAVAAYTAEVLRHSPFVFLRHPGLKMPAALRRADELSANVEGRVSHIPSFEEFTSLIRKEMNAHPSKRPAKD